MTRLTLILSVTMQNLDSSRERREGAAVDIQSIFHARLNEHFHCDVTQLSIVAKTFERYDHPNLQRALDLYLENPNRQYELLGVMSSNEHMGPPLVQLLMSNPDKGGAVTIGPVQYMRISLQDGHIKPCVQYGLYLISKNDERLAVLVRAPGENVGGHVGLSLEVMGVSAAFVKELLRKAALLAVEDDREEIIVSEPHLEEALHEMLLHNGFEKTLVGASRTMETEKSIH